MVTGKDAARRQFENGAAILAESILCARLRCQPRFQPSGGARFEAEGQVFFGGRLQFEAASCNGRSAEGDRHRNGTGHRSIVLRGDEDLPGIGIVHARDARLLFAIRRAR